MSSQTENGMRNRTTPALVQTEVKDMRGNIVHWDGKHGVIRTDDGIEVSFFPVHLTADCYAGQLRIGDRIYFRCEVITSKEYCLERIRAVALA